MPTWDGLCDVDLTYRETRATPHVFVGGAWNSFSQTATELTDDGTGTYHAALRLAPGLYAYKFYVTGDGADGWRIDPVNGYRVFESGVENSGLRVADCSKPKLTVAAHHADPAASTFSASINYVPEVNGTVGTVSGTLHSADGTREITPIELVSSGNSLSLTLHGLMAGKYTAKLTPTSAAGVAGESLLLPFWIEAKPFDWHDAILYMGVTDRFQDGDATNNQSVPTAAPGEDWQGGDLQGVQQALASGYFDRLGINAIWLTPYNTNPQGTFADADGVHADTGYHGYWPIDPLHVEVRIGGEAGLDAMVNEAHKHGVRILMDWAMNDVHQQHTYVQSHPDWFTEGCVCGSNNCDWTAHRLDCLFSPYMPDVNWQNKDAEEQFVADALTWIEAHDLDGIRVDAVKHMPDNAIADLAIRVRERFETAGTKMFLLGETAMGWDNSSGPDAGGNTENYGTISQYIGPQMLDGQFDFVLYYAASLQFLNDTPGRGMAHVDYWTQASAREYPSTAIMTPYLGSHDTSRFISQASSPSQSGSKWDNLPSAPSTSEAYDRMYVAYGWLFSVPGMPLLYYGDEYGEFGGADPDNRHMMRFGSALSTMESAQLARVTSLVQARRNVAPLRSSQSFTVYTDDDVYAVLRGDQADNALVVINRSGSATHQVLSIAADKVADGRMFNDALDSTFYVTNTGGTITLDLAPRSVRYLH